jgi:hypothetical protein
LLTLPNDYLVFAGAADFKFKAKMSGFMQTSFFFGYMGMVRLL